jgi:pimeloyl-ACP methyl ester carboxylesterase
MRADADLSLRGNARLVEELLEHLELGGVTLVGNDTGGALVQLLMSVGGARVSRACSPPTMRLTTCRRA